ncbi:hypothetical protein ABZY90_27700 [Streptomyces sp. NPDC006422]|uniref:hypothetical protein n=1 Tax=unclassified Streptomyces TaxID=2593676 RepID=UPI00339E2609
MWQESLGGASAGVAMQYVRGGGLRWAATVVLVVALLLAAAPGARARPTNPGGMDIPDLAVVIAPGAAAGPSVAVHDDDPEFAALERLTTGFDTVTERVPESWQEGHFPPVVATVVWGLTGVGGWPQTHRAPGTDTVIERQDQLIVADDGTPWIRTDPAVDVTDDDLRWHRASPKLVDRLTEAGLLPTPPPQDDDATTPWWWALAGLATGLTAAAALWHIRSRGPREPREPRQELVDL